MSWGHKCTYVLGMYTNNVLHMRMRSALAHHCFITFCFPQLNIMNGIISLRQVILKAKPGNIWDNIGKTWSYLSLFARSMRLHGGSPFRPNPSFMLHLISHLDDDAKHCHCQVKQDQSTRNALVVLCLGLIDCKVGITNGAHLIGTQKLAAIIKACKTSASPTLLHHLGCPCVYCSSR